MRTVLTYAMARPVPYRIISRRSKLRITPLLFLWRLFLAFVKLTLAIVLMILLAGCVAYYFYRDDVRDVLASLESLPDPAIIGQRHPAETTQIYARDGKTLLYELVDPQSGRRTVVQFDH